MKYQVWGQRFDALLGSSAIALLLCGSSFAQNAPPGDAKNPGLEEVIVTAQKRAERLENVPISITVVDAARLESSGVVGFQDIHQIAVGTHISRVGVYLQPSIRGISTQVVGVGQENNVAVYVDGFYQPSQIGINTDFNSIKSIQVLKGPQGTLFGRNATGGAILIDTLDPSFTPTGKVSASFATFNEKIAQAYFSAGLTDNLAFDVAAYYKQSDGYIEDIGGFDTNPVKSDSFRSKFLLTPGKALRVTATAEYHRVEDAAALAATYFDRQLAVALAPSVPIATAPNRTSLNFGPESKTETTTGAVKLEYDFDPVALTSLTRYSHERGFINFDLDGSTLRIFEQQLDTRQDTLTQEFNLGAADSERFDWVTGAFFSSNDARYFDNRVLIDPATNTYSPASDSKMRTKAAAVYGDATYHLDNGLSFTGGLRYSWEERKFFFAQPYETVLVDNAKESWDSVTPRAVVRYEVAPDSNVYLSLSKGFKSGTFNTTTADPVPVDPEKVTAYEIGFKTAQGGLHFDAAAYYYDYTDLQVSVLTILNNNQEAADLSNAAKAEIYGVEAQLSFSPADRLDLSLSAAYNHARYADYKEASVFPPAGNLNAPPQVQDWSDLRIIGAPDVTATLGFQFTQPTNAGNFIFGGNVYYSSEFAPNYDDQLDGEYRYEQDAYALVNLNATWAPPGDHWRFTVFGRNVTDEKIRINFGGNPFGDLAVYAEPASYGGRIDYSF